MTRIDRRTFKNRRYRVEHFSLATQGLCRFCKTESPGDPIFRACVELKDFMAQTITCPDCGLVLRVIDGRTMLKFVYDMRDWRRVCARLHLGDAAWCLIQHDGTDPLPPATDRSESGRDIADLVIIDSHCVGLERIIERLEEEGLAVKVLNAGSTGGLAAAKRGECDVAPIHLMDPGGFARGSRQGGLLQRQQRLRRHLERMLSDRPQIGAKDRRAPATLRPQCALFWAVPADRSLAPGRLTICDRIRYFLSNGPMSSVDRVRARKQQASAPCGAP